MKTLDELKMEGKSKQWLYRRVIALEEAGLLKAKRGPANTILLDPLQEKLLQRLISLEANCRRTSIAIEKLKFELTLLENQELRRKLEQRDREIQRLHALIEVRASWWRRIADWVRRFFTLRPQRQLVDRT